MDREDTLQALQAENKRLHELLEKNGIEADLVVTQVGGLPETEKIRIFRARFRGREDVYAVRWLAQNGKSGYSPQSDRDWLAYNAAAPSEKHRIDRETRKLIALNDEAVRAHLQGKITIGIYPLLLNETCWFLAADFDKTSWKEDFVAFLETCEKYGVPAYLEISRSGKGGHVWIFFAQNVPASLARRLGAFLLTRTMERRHQLGLDSYD